MCGWLDRARAAGAALLSALWAWLLLVLLLALGVVLLVVLAQPARASEAVKGIGQVLGKAEIAAIDRDVRCDGAGLPPGSGGVAMGEALYAEQCAACHGEFGEGVGRNPALLGGEGSLSGDEPLRTIGSFWPCAPGVFDYVWRAMPEGHAFSLKPEEVYAVTAFLLNLNGIVEDDFSASATTLPKVRMPNRDGFVGPPHPVAKARRCMRNCRVPPNISAQAPVRMEGIMIGEKEEWQP